MAYSENGVSDAADSDEAAPEPPDDIDILDDEDTLFAGWPPVDPVDVVEGGRLFGTSAFEAGGVSYNAVLYDTDSDTETDDDGSDWLLIDSCYD